MEQGLSDTIFVAIWECEVQNPDHSDRWRFVICEYILIL